MNSKLSIILAVILIAISGFGILMTRGEKEYQTSQEKQKVLSKVFVLTKDIKKGEIISPNDIAIEEKRFNVNEIQDSYIINKSLAYLKNSIATIDLKAQTILKYEFISKDNNKEVGMLELSNPNDLPFDFVLHSREFGIIKHMKKGELTDIYFRYEVKNKGTENTIVAQGRDNTSSKENGNLANLVLLFKDKRILDIRKDSKVKTTLDSQLTNASGTLVLQMSSDEIRSIYAIENLGKFYFFPSKPQKILPSGVSTQEVLSQNFIKELRGGDK